MKLYATIMLVGGTSGFIAILIARLLGGDEALAVAIVALLVAIYAVVKGEGT